MKIRDVNKLRYRIGEVIKVDYHIPDINHIPEHRKRRHNRVGIVIDYVEKYVYDTYSCEEKYYVYKILVGSEAFEISENDLEDMD